MIRTVLFDLDGTLLPFEQEDFIKIYFSELCKKLAPMGYQPESTVKSVWGGTKAMIMNDGSRLSHTCRTCTDKIIFNVFSYFFRCSKLSLIYSEVSVSGFNIVFHSNFSFLKLYSIHCIHKFVIINL